MIVEDALLQKFVEAIVFHLTNLAWVEHSFEIVVLCLFYDVFFSLKIHKFEPSFCIAKFACTTSALHLFIAMNLCHYSRKQKSRIIGVCKNEVKY